MAGHVALFGYYAGVAHGEEEWCVLLENPIFTSILK